MNRDRAQHYLKELPNILKFASENFKKLLAERGADFLDKSTGLLGILINIFGKPLIDHYYEGISEDKLANLGLQTYLKAAFAQAEISLEKIQNQGDLPDDINFDKDEVKRLLSAQQEHYKEKPPLPAFSPKYHPAVIFVKEVYVKLFQTFQVPDEVINKFKKHYNDNIEKQVVFEFGEDYKKHLDEIKEIRLKEIEYKFLFDMIKLSRIGFTKEEELDYQDTYATWENIANFRLDRQQFIDEDNLEPIEHLIEQYFPMEDTINKILFIISDFGKGKTVFLKHYASKLAEKYLQTGEGFFPIYFNLKEYTRFSNDSKFGCISNFLLGDYGIDLEEDDCRNKRYAFLIDSLDESGKLTSRDIDDVMGSVQLIQRLDLVNCRQNRLIITSRPFDDGLKNHLGKHDPYCKLNKDNNKNEPQFIYIYGFKKPQFIDWLTKALRKASIKEYRFTEQSIKLLKQEGIADQILENLEPLKNQQAMTKQEFLKMVNIHMGAGQTPPNIILKHSNILAPFIKEIMNSIRQGQQIDIYGKFSEIISEDERRRPIFAYMLYQLLINNVDFQAIGKIGIYLEFINVLTKDAKYKKEPHSKVNLEEEFKFRNILHAIAALWIYEQQRGTQASLRKSDIYQTTTGKVDQDGEQRTLEKFREIKELAYLSHSYFFEDEKTLSFQHQSFAEMLLAEYYLKVFIKFALDKNWDVDEARSKLALGQPTEQTILFFKEMLTCLKTCASEEITEDVLQKRKMFVYLLSSLATPEYNKTLLCDYINYKWFEKIKIQVNQVDIPEEHLREWPMGSESISAIINLAKKMLESDTQYLLTKAALKNPLFNNEVVLIPKNMNTIPPDIDRWLALLVGNTLFNDEAQGAYFAGRIKRSRNLFDLIRNWNHAFQRPAPEWGLTLFRGINLSENKDVLDMSNMNLSYMDFSHSVFNNFTAKYSNFNNCSFNQAKFENFKIPFSSLRGAKFFGTDFQPSDLSLKDSIKEAFDLEFCSIDQGVFIPYPLCEVLNQASGDMYVNYGSDKMIVKEISPGNLAENVINSIFNSLEGLLAYAIQNTLVTKIEIKSWFKFENADQGDCFSNKVDELWRNMIR